MIKKILSCLLAFVGITALYAGELPTVSTIGNEVWYLIQFSEGGFVFDGATDGADLRNETATGADAQLWKFEGNESSGFTITNKLGHRIYVTQADKNGAVKVAAAPTSGTQFKLVATENTAHPGTFEILPAANEALGLNMAGGVEWRNGKVGMWDKKDINNCLTFVPAVDYEVMKNISIIPYPQEIKPIKAGALDFKTLKTIKCPLASLGEHFADFQNELEAASGIHLDVVNSGAADIEMSVNDQLAAEGYTLKVNDNGIVIQAKGEAGFFYALQTLKQLLPRAYFEHKRNEQVAWTVPFVDIKDQPALGHRGFMLDISRHFFDKQEVMRILDVMAFYKMNIFHWHLTDDQGWRIEIPEYPKLTEVGSIRKASQSSSGFWDDTEYGRGMWYSQQDLKEVVAYAAARNIDIIPEVDFPGHMMGAVTAYPELSCDPTKTYEVRVWGGISEDVLNIGNDEVIKFLKTVLDNLAKIFPYEYIHFGGDECPTKQWETNAQCLQRVKDKKLAGVQELQSWLIEELGTYVRDRYQKKIMVWDELTKHWNKKNQIKPVVMCWHNNNDVANNLGLHTITCPHDYTYLDMMQIDKNHALVDEPYRGGWNDDKVTTVEKTYSLNPHYKTPGNIYNVLGVQANMWTETTNDNEELEYQVFPRLIATAEVGWLPVEKKNWASFRNRLQSHDEILDFMEVNYAKHSIDPEEKTPLETAVDEARKILVESVKGGAGYPAAATYEALQNALKAADAAGATQEQLTALQQAIQSYKEAEILQPEVGKMYQIVSASTYYQQQYAGSSLYQTAKGLRIHYTPQAEPEELWEFVNKDGQLYLQNVGSKRQVVLGTFNAAAGLNAAGTAIRVDKATLATRNYSYIPGVVTISAVEGYNAAETGSVKRLVAQNSGDVHVADEASLCYPGTWKLMEVTDFTAQLQGLCKKCEAVIRNARPEENGQPTAEALAFLQNEVLTPARTALNAPVSRTDYLKYDELYHQFLAMPVKTRGKVTALSQLNPNKCYTLTAGTDALMVKYPDMKYVSTLAHANDAYEMAADYNNKYQQFAFVKRGDKYYLYSVAARKFLNHKDGVNYGNDKNNVLLADKGQQVTFEKSTVGSRPDAVMIHVNGKTMNVSNAKVFDINSWSQHDIGNAFYVEEAADFDFEAIQPSVLEADGSFGAQMHWYKLYLPNVNIQPNADCVLQTSAQGALDSKKEYNDQMNEGQYFAFVKHENGGYLIYNYQTGKDKVLWSEQPSAADFEGHRLSMMPKTAAAQTWMISPNLNKESSYFGYNLQRSDVANGYVSRKSNGIGYWVAGGAARDPHSCFHFVEIAMKDIEAEADRLAAVPAGAVGSNVYFLDPVKRAAFDEAYQAYKKDVYNPAKFEALHKEVVAAQAVTEKVQFVADRLYRLENVKNHGWLEVNATTLVPGALSTSNANLLWKITRDGEQATLKHMNSGLFISSLNQVGAVQGNFKLTNIAGSTTEFGIHKTVGNQEKYICHNKQHNSIVGWHEPSLGGDHGWYLIPAATLDVNMAVVGDNSYTSLYLPFAVGLPDGVEAYSGSLNEARRTLTMQKLGNELPENTGVVLKGVNRQTQMTVNILSGTTATVENNALTGTHVAKTVAAGAPNIWVLGNKDNVLGFYHFGMTGQADKTLAPNKAYIDYTSPTGANGYRMDFGDLTGIEGIADQKWLEDPVYDLSGRRVLKMVKGGIYIQHGQKFIAK